MCSAKNGAAAVSCATSDVSVQGVGSRSKGAHVTAIHVLWAALQAKIDAGTSGPPVLTPAIPPENKLSFKTFKNNFRVRDKIIQIPAADTHATQTVLQPVWHKP